VSVAIVGGGLAGLCAYATLRHGGLEPDEIVVYGDRADPTEAWAARAGAIRQRRMRSESDGHVAATSFPGLAVRTARRRLSLTPLALSVCNRYRPSVDEFLEHAAEVRERSGWDSSFVHRRVERVQAVEGGFRIDDRESFAHVLLALGHPGLALPRELEGDARVVHAYEPHEYADEVEVVGAGMAAATEWLNALEAGAEVVSVRRHEPARRPLNVARPLFTKRGLSSFHATPAPERAALLRRYAEASYPPGRSWDQPLEDAGRAGRFRVESGLNGSLEGVEQVICATGFQRGYQRDPLLARLVADHQLETEDDWIVLADDSTVPAVTDATRTLALAGVSAQWAFPAADTLVGMKVAARGFRRRIESCPTR
jgi:cation diffusion facilitator CzcD-associated flavoprotein CzcO